MDLREFVQTTLEQIAEGARAAETKVNEAGGFMSGGTVQTIDFDVALTTTTANEKDGHGEAKLAILSLGGAAKSATSAEQVSRVRFHVAMFLPRPTKQVANT